MILSFTLYQHNGSNDECTKYSSYALQFLLAIVLIAYVTEPVRKNSIQKNKRHEKAATVLDFLNERHFFFVLIVHDLKKQMQQRRENYIATNKSKNNSYHP